MWCSKGAWEAAAPALNECTKPYYEDRPSLPGGPHLTELHATDAQTIKSPATDQHSASNQSYVQPPAVVKAVPLGLHELKGISVRTHTHTHTFVRHGRTYLTHQDSQHTDHENLQMHVFVCNTMLSLYYKYQAKLLSRIS